MDHSALVLGLNWIDLGILGLALVIGVWGWRLGILRAAVVLVAVVLGVLLAGAYHARVLTDLAIDDAPSGMMRAISFVVILALVSLGGYVLGTLLKGIASLLLLGWADRAAGGIFGVLFGLLLVQAIIAIVVLAGLDDAHGAIGESLVGWRMLDNVPVVRALLPAEFDLAIQGFVAEVEALRDSVEQIPGPRGGG